MSAFNSMYIDAQTNNASDLTEAQAIHDAGLIILYNVTALALQTLFYGIYVVLILFSTWVLCQRGLPRANLMMLVTILVMFISSTSGFWVHTVTVLKRIRSLLVEQPGEPIAAKLPLIRDSLRGMEGGAFYCSLINVSVISVCE
ncbi:hypothetical protein HETIRDRAFT_317734 [Heterobasidion irregulare TC 32-1]|uniref:Uncharacterized protein n=1 Tax=Heterobasidion irregulare (strain TC 32-1) TaxID=747525 RepID=W4K7X0_HETIT|nr:uncharacterized protein HETIRDRAFT_317734 [Heterobasidion irregulare TC 32-1]ETW81922.1 hypothetical protein HETIRDRAFT_317734 [Heterobasidion irregulare TC 32-1]